MKRILVSILAFLYLSSSMGATIHLHYCMEKLISWGLIDHESKGCISCGMYKETGGSENVLASKSCCKDEHKEIKTDKDQKVTSAEFQFFKLSPDATAAQMSNLPFVWVFSFTTENPKTNAPPSIQERPLFLLNRNFRI
jgi:hypothetical protein